MGTHRDDNFSINGGEVLQALQVGQKWILLWFHESDPFTNAKKNVKRAAYADVEAFRAGEVGEAIQVDQGIVVLVMKADWLERDIVSERLV